jgi:molybdopterin molybdotransferase
MQTELGCGDPLTADALSIEAAARRIEAEAGKKKRSGRAEFQRGRLTVDADGQVAVSKTGVQGSVILSSMSAADCFIVLPPESGTVEPGDTVWVEPFEGIN